MDQKPYTADLTKVDPNKTVTGSNYEWKSLSQCITLHAVYCNGRIVHPPGSSLRKRLAWQLAPPLGVQDPPLPVHPPSCGQCAPVCGSQGSPGGNHWSSCNWKGKNYSGEIGVKGKPISIIKSYWKFPTIVSLKPRQNPTCQQAWKPSPFLGTGSRCCTNIRNPDATTWRLLCELPSSSTENA